MAQCAGTVKKLSLELGGNARTSTMRLVPSTAASRSGIVKNDQCAFATEFEREFLHRARALGPSGSFQFRSNR